MILKEKDVYTGDDERAFYGHKQEQDVAYHLRREFGDSDQVRIIHDLMIEHDGERAQIDHLVIHPFGFIIIESKSIVGEVRVNSEGEWSRSYRSNWTGMKSPILQAELQMSLLKALLRSNVERLVGKIFGIQAQVGGRDWQALCAVSSTAILHREKMPREVACRVVKTEFLSRKVKDIVGNTTIGFLKGKPRFSIQELEDIGAFLLEHTAWVGRDSSPPEPLSTESVSAISMPAPVQETMPPCYVVATEVTHAEPAMEEVLLSCKACGETHQLIGLNGQYGYYVKCGRCNTNTSMKLPCPACGWRSVMVKKDGKRYTAICRKCEHRYLVYQQE